MDHRRYCLRLRVCYYCDKTCNLRLQITIYYIYTVSQKNPTPESLWQFFQNGWEFFDQILHAYYAFVSTLDYKFLFNYLQL